MAFLVSLATAQNPTSALIVLRSMLAAS